MRRFCIGVLIVGCIVGGGVPLAGAQNPVVLASGKEPQRIPVAASPLITDPKSADYSLDLRPLLEKMDLKERETFVTRTPEGLRVFALSDDGALDGLIVRDTYGDQLDRLEVWGQDRDHRPDDGVNASREKKGTTHCWRCFSYRGESHCFEVLCLPATTED